MVLEAFLFAQRDPAKIFRQRVGLQRVGLNRDCWLVKPESEWILNREFLRKSSVAFPIKGIRYIICIKFLLPWSLHCYIIRLISYTKLFWLLSVHGGVPNVWISPNSDSGSNLAKFFRANNPDLFWSNKKQRFVNLWSLLRAEANICQNRAENLREIQIITEGEETFLCILRSSLFYLIVWKETLQIRGVKTLKMLA